MPKPDAVQCREQLEACRLKVAELEAAVVWKDARILELETNLVGADLRVAELQSEVESQADTIAELEARIAELEGTPTEPEEPTEPPPEPAPLMSLVVYDCDTGQPAPGIEPLLDGQTVTIHRDGMPANWTLVAWPGPDLTGIGSVVFSGDVFHTENSPPYAMMGDTLWTDPNGVLHPFVGEWGSSSVSVTAWSAAGGGGILLARVYVTLTVDTSAPTEDGRTWDDLFVYPMPRPDWTTAQALLHSYQMALLLYRRRLRDGLDTTEAEGSLRQYAESYSDETGYYPENDRISQEIWASIREIETGL